MAKADNKLRGATYFGSDNFLHQKSSSVGTKDLDNLYRFSIGSRSNFEMRLSEIKKGANIDVELYRLKSPFAEIRRKIGKIDFRKLRSQDRKTHLQQVSVSRKVGNKDEILQLGLESGEYVLRVLQRSGNSSYSMFATAKSISPPPLLVAPTATFNGNLLISDKSSYYDFTVTYSDDVAIDVSNIDNSDILVTSSNGFSQLATRIAINDSSNGTPRIVTYRINAPNGSWDSSENGLYNIKLQENQVSDTSGSFATAGFIGNFFVNVDQPPLVDREAPQASLNATSPWKNSNEAYTFMVSYTDNAALDVASIDNNDVLVTNSQGYSQLAEKISVNGSGDGIAYSVTYRINAPNEGWNSTANGFYQVSLQPNQVRDLSNNFVTAGALGSFSIQIDAPTTRTPSDLFEMGGAPDGSSTIFQVDFSKQDEDTRSDFGLFRGALVLGTVSGGSTNPGFVPWSPPFGDGSTKTFTNNPLISFNSINGGTSYQTGDLISFKNAEGKTEFRGILFTPDNYALCIGFTASSTDSNLPNSLILLKSSLSAAEAQAVRYIGYAQDFQTGSKTLETVSLSTFINFGFVSDRLMSPEEQDYTLEQGLDPSNYSGGSGSSEKVFGAIGNQLNNRITGNDSSNKLVGKGGDDRLFGEDNSDELYGGTGNDQLYGGNGGDTLNGYSDRNYNSIINDESQFDTLVGGSGNDIFVLGEGNNIYYVESGDGYAIIQDWEPDIDRIQTASVSGGQYTIEYKHVLGNPSKLDTEIYYSNGNIRDRIAILQDIEDNPFD